jgi:hypothetical protein
MQQHFAIGLGREMVLAAQNVPEFGVVVDLTIANQEVGRCLAENRLSVRVSPHDGQTAKYQGKYAIVVKLLIVGTTLSERATHGRKDMPTLMGI